jgi:xanthosine phosphorylase
MKPDADDLPGPDAAASFIAGRVPAWTPRVGLILGSGLGDIAEAIAARAAIAYTDIPGFPRTGVEGHRGRLVLGELGGVPVACLQGRVHVYEGIGPRDIQIPVRTLKRLGCTVLVITNAAGGIRVGMAVGSLMLIADHISLLPFSPLVGANDDSFGPRFPAMDRTYDAELRRLMHAASRKAGVPLHDGVYAACLGPQFETPAEVLALARLGADAAGMSTVPEAIVATHCGMRVVAISAIVSAAAGIAREALTHEQTLAVAAEMGAALQQLLTVFLQMLPHEPATGCA